MSYRDIQMIADFMNESAAQEAKYSRACKMWESKQKDYDDEDVKVIDPASLGFNTEPKRSKMCNEDITDDQWTEAYKWFEAHGYKVHDSDEGGFTFSEEVDGKQFYTADEGWQLYKKLSSQVDEGILEQDCCQDDDTVDASEYGFCELQEADDDVLHDDDEVCSIVVDVTNEDEFADNRFSSFVAEKLGNIVQVEKLTEDGESIAQFKVSGELGNLKKFYALYVGKDSWDDVLGTDDEDEFCNLLVFEDGDTLAEAQLRENVAVMLDDIDLDDCEHAHNTDGAEPIEKSLDVVGVKASTANLAGQDEVEMSVVEKLQKRVEELEKKLLLGDTPEEDSKSSDDTSSLKKFFEDEEDDEIQLEDEEEIERVTPEEFLEDQLDVALTAKEYVDKKAAGEELTQEEQDFIKFAEDFCDCKLTEEYLKSATAQEIERKVRQSSMNLNKSGFAASNVRWTQYHQPDENNAGNIKDEVYFNPNGSGRIGRLEARRKAKEEEARAKLNGDLPKRGNKHWNWPEWQKVLNKLTPEQAEELYYELMDDAMSSGRSGEAALIKQMFGKKVHSANRVAGTAVQYSDNDKKHGSRSDQSRFETNLLNKLEEVLTVLSQKDRFALATKLLQKYNQLWQLRKMSEEAFKEMIDAQRAAGKVKPNTKPTRKNLFDAGIKAIFNAMNYADKQFISRFCEEWLKRTLRRDWPEKWLPKYDELKAKWKAEASGQTNESLKNALIGGAIGTGVGAVAGTLASDKIKNAGDEIANSTPGAKELTDLENYRNAQKSIIDMRANAEGTAAVNNNYQPDTDIKVSADDLPKITHADVDANIDNARENVFRTGIANDADAVRSAVGKTIAKKPLATSAAAGGVIGAGIGSMVGNKKGKSASSAKSTSKSGKKTKKA